ncbi:TIP120-domain-containing protein [Wallemia mellicola]|nr:TIP120-domain-containing protein [Wallemia mellicola]TIC36401.1 TIP120-domain-containing protein [Wallemia mellicola]
MAQQQKVISLINKLKDVDSDYRFMAMNDLNLLIKNYQIINDDLEIELIDSLLKSLDDNNFEVKQLTSNSIELLLNKLKLKSLNYLIDNLFELLKNNKKDDLNDIYLVTIKLIIKNLDNIQFINLDKLIKNVLVLDLSIESLDILLELIHNFILNRDQSIEVLDSQFNILSSSARYSLKKKSIYIISLLIDDYYQDKLNEFINNNINSQFIITNLLITNTLNILNNTNHLDIIIHHLDNSDDEIKESALLTLEAFIKHLNPQQHLESLIALSSKFISYNPNYFEIDDDDDDIDEDDDEDQEDEPLSDNDDLSWKVRKASAKLISTITLNNPHLLHQLCSSIFLNLLNITSNEREESVKLEMFNAINSFFLINASLNERCSLKRKHNEMDLDLNSDLQNETYQKPLIKTITKHLNDKSLVIRLNAYKLLNTLVNTFQDSLQSPHIDDITPFIEQGLKDIQSTISAGLPIEILTFLNSLFRTHTYRSIHQAIPSLTDALINTTKLTKYHKLCSLALTSLENLVTLLRPLREDGKVSPYPLQQERIDSYLELINNAVNESIQDSELSNNVKEDAINVVAVLLSHAGDIITKNNDSRSLSLLSSRLSNNLTRLAAIKAIKVAANSPTCDGQLFQTWFLEFLKQITPLIKQNDRVVKITTFECLEALLDRVVNEIDLDLANELITSTLPLITINDLHTLPYALNIASQLVQGRDEIRNSVVKVLHQSYSLVLSPLLVLGGQGLDSLEKFYQLTVTYNPSAGPEIVSNLLDQVKDVSVSDVGGEGEHILANVSKLIGGVIVTSKGDIENFLNVLKSPNQVSHVYLSLLVVGEVGKDIDLSVKYPDLFTIVGGYFNNDQDNIRRASSFSLGNISAGSTKIFLPELLKLMKNSDYLILSSIKQVISQSVEQIDQDQIDKLFNSLISVGDDENVRNVSAECLGKLCLSMPSTYLPKVKDLLDFEETKLISIVAIRYTLTESTNENYLVDIFNKFDQLLVDSNLEVKKMTLSTINSAARHKPTLIKESNIPLLLQQTDSKPELIREITLGPFKEKIDDGLPIRKTAYECLYTISNHCVSLISKDDLIGQVLKGLNDVDEIKILTYLILNRLVMIDRDVVMNSIEEIIQKLEKVLLFKPKDSATKMEHERNSELQTSVLRTLATLNSVISMERNEHLNKVIKQTVEPNAQFRNTFLSCSNLTASQFSDAMQTD